MSEHLYGIPICKECGFNHYPNNYCPASKSNKIEIERIVGDMTNPPQETSELKACGCTNYEFKGRIYITICDMHKKEFTKYSSIPGTVTYTPSAASAEDERIVRDGLMDLWPNGYKPEKLSKMLAALDRIIERMK